MPTASPSSVLDYDILNRRAGRRRHCELSFRVKATICKESRHTGGGRRSRSFDEVNRCSEGKMRFQNVAAEEDEFCLFRCMQGGSTYLHRGIPTRVGSGSLQTHGEGSRRDREETTTVSFLWEWGEVKVAKPPSS